jgi:hypothetical protein
MDISKVDEIVELDEAELQVTDPISGDPMFRLLLAGPDHVKSQAARVNENRRVLAGAKRAGGVVKAFEAQIESSLSDPEDALDREVRHLVARTLNWKDVEKDGVPIPFDAKVIEGLYRGKSWLREQVNDFLGAAKNFRAHSSKH